MNEFDSGTRISVEFEYTFAEVQEGVGKLTRGLLGRRFRRQLPYLTAAISVFVGLWVFMFSFTTAPAPASHATGTPLASGETFFDRWSWLFYILIVFVACGAVLIRAMRGRATPKDHPLLHRRWILTANEVGIAMTTTFERSEYQWPAFERWFETRQNMLLYRTGSAAVVIPKRIFADRPDEFAVFTGLLRDRIRAKQLAFPVVGLQGSTFDAR